jgi:hypothetical protein
MCGQYGGCSSDAGCDNINDWEVRGVERLGWKRAQKRTRRVREETSRQAKRGREEKRRGEKRREEKRREE